MTPPELEGKKADEQEGRGQSRGGRSREAGGTQTSDAAEARRKDRRSDSAPEEEAVERPERSIEV